MKNTTTLQSKRSITVLLGVLLYFSSLSAQTMQDTIIANFSPVSYTHLRAHET